MIAIAGSTGFIGQHLTAALLKQGAYIRHYRADLTQPDEAYTFVIGCETVYMLAGVTGGAQVLKDDPRKLVAPNVRLHLSMFEACAKAGVKRIICMSSTTGYPDFDHPLKEDEYFQGEVYPAYFNPGHTRRFIERAGAMYPELSVIFLRCSGCYGPHDDFKPETSHVIAATVRKIAERHDPVIVWGDGLDERDGVYIDDIVEALILFKTLEGHHAINIGTGRAMSVNEMIATLTNKAGYFPQVTFDLNKPQCIRRRILNVDKAKSLGWQAKVGMEEGLCKTLDWYASR